VREDVLNRARSEHEALLARAKEDIEAERAKAVESVRRDAVDLALAAAAKLVEQKFDSDNDRKLVTDFLKRVQSPGARA
jgi:F-type H+-transporting ATPase subunit b